VPYFWSLVLPLVISYQSPSLWTSWAETCNRCNKIVWNSQPPCTQLICLNEETDFDVKLHAVRWRVLDFCLLPPTSHIPLATGWTPEWGWKSQVWEEEKDDRCAHQNLSPVSDLRQTGTPYKTSRLCWPNLAVHPCSSNTSAVQLWHRNR
jgi:hypothetical protein